MLLLSYFLLPTPYFLFPLCFLPSSQLPFPLDPPGRFPRLLPVLFLRFLMVEARHGLIVYTYKWPKKGVR
jgi:hypothetical protein